MWIKQIPNVCNLFILTKPLPGHDKHQIHVLWITAVFRDELNQPSSYNYLSHHFKYDETTQKVEFCDNIDGLKADFLFNFVLLI